MDPNLAAVAVSAVLLVLLVLGAVAGGWSMRGRAADAEVALERDVSADARAESAEWERRYHAAVDDAEEAARRAQAAVVRARARGADVADPDDAAAFERVLSRARAKRGAAAGEKPAAAGGKAGGADPRADGAVAG